MRLAAKPISVFFDSRSQFFGDTRYSTTNDDHAQRPSGRYVRDLSPCWNTCGGTAERKLVQCAEELRASGLGFGIGSRVWGTNTGKAATKSIHIFRRSLGS